MIFCQLYIMTLYYLNTNSYVAEYMFLDAKVLLSFNTEIHGLYFVPITFTMTADVLVFVTSFVGKDIVM